MRVGLESTFGTAATSFTPVRVRSVEPTFDQQPIYDETIEDFVPATAVPGPLALSLRAELAARPNQITEILAALMGSHDVKGDVAPYTWTFELADPKSLTVEVGDPSTAWQFVGVGISSAEFTFEAREVVTLSLDMIAKSFSETTTPTSLDYSTEQPFVFHEAALYVDGSKVAGCRSVSVSIDRALADDAFVLDDRTLYALHGGVTNISGRLRLWETEIAQFRKVAKTTGWDQVDLQITAVRGTDYELTLSMPVTIYQSGSFSLSGRDPVDREIEYRALGLKITLKNEVSTI